MEESNLSEDGLGSSSGLSPEAQARLALVQERLEGDGELNPNLVDTPAHLQEHGFRWLNGRQYGTK